MDTATPSLALHWSVGELAISGTQRFKARMGRAEAPLTGEVSRRKPGVPVGLYGSSASRPTGTRTVSRRTLITTALGLVGGFAASGCAVPIGQPQVTDRPTVPTADLPSPRALPPLTTFRGADLSFTLELEAAGLRFSDSGRTEPVEVLLAARGANLIRIRLWVNPRPGSNDLRSALLLGRRANAVGCHIMLNLHCSDSWADPYNQGTPAVWAGQPVDELARTLHGYTRDVVAAFVAQGTPPAMVQVGNELSNGMLWPTGHVRPESDEGFENLATLLRAGLAGAREGTPEKVLTVVHTDTGGNGEVSSSFFDNLRTRGVDFDVAGFSFFPWWHGRLEDLAATLTAVAKKFQKPVAVVETSYPWTIPADRTMALHVWDATRLPERDTYSPTPTGQADFLRALRKTVEGVPDGAGLGFVAWEPAWLPDVAANPGDPNRFANLTMFDWNGVGLPSLSAFTP